MMQRSTSSKQSRIPLQSLANKFDDFFSILAFFRAQHVGGFVFSLCLLLTGFAGVAWLQAPDSWLGILICSICTLCAVLGIGLHDKITSREKSRIVFVLSLFLTLMGFFLLNTLYIYECRARLVVLLIILMLLLDVGYIMFPDNGRMYACLVLKYVILWGFMWFVLNQQTPWGNAGKFLKTISAFPVLSLLQEPSIIVDILIVIVVDIAPFRAGLQKQTDVPCLDWNVFDYGQLRLRKSYATVVGSGGIVCLLLLCFRYPQDVPVAMAIEVLSLVSSLFILFGPIEESTIEKAVANHLIHVARIPRSWDKQAKLCERVHQSDQVGDDSLRGQLMLFHREWRRLANVCGFNQQVRVLQSMQKMITAGVPTSGACEQDVALLAFVMGMLCATKCVTEEKAEQYLKRIKDESCFLYNEDEFQAGMFYGFMVVATAGKCDWSVPEKIRTSSYYCAIMGLRWAEQDLEKYENNFLCQLKNHLRRWEEVENEYAGA